MDKGTDNYILVIFCIPEGLGQRGFDRKAADYVTVCTLVLLVPTYTTSVIQNMWVNDLLGRGLHRADLSH